jgi:hypothetical protein
MKYKKNIIILFLCICIVFVGGVLYFNALSGDKYISMLLGNRPYIVLENCPSSDKVIGEFYSVWKSKKGFMAYCETLSGIDVIINRYWIVENGHVKIINEEKRIFPTYYILEPNSIYIVYEKPDGTFVPSEPNESREHSLKLSCKSEKSDWVKISMTAL